MIARLFHLIRRLYTRIWLRFHWRQLRDNAPEEYVKALERER